MSRHTVGAAAAFIFFTCLSGCKRESNVNNGNNGGNGGSGGSTSKYTVSSWITNGDKSLLLQPQADQPAGTSANSYSNIDVDSTQTYQSVDGFGYALTGGSAKVINKLTAGDKASLLQELFGTGDHSIGVSYLRISMGASDLNDSVYSYDDVATGQTDISLNHFSLAEDTIDVIPLLKEILAINPHIKLIATPWSAPVWMKDNASTMAGSLQAQYYNAYATYFVKYIQAMQTNGITITAITPQNEPLNNGNNPSMVMTSQQELDFIKNSLGPAFHTAGIQTKIIVYDHNCDRPDYPEAILSDAGASQYVDGSAFHLYAGDVSALSAVHDAYPAKNLYFTEQWTGSTESFSGDLQWHVKNVIIGTMRNWSKVALEWNLASDSHFNPHTPGGCTECMGAITADGAVSRNVSYYILAHASKFVPPGSVRISSNITANLNNVAFQRPDGKKVLIVENDNPDAITFNVRFNGQWIVTHLGGGNVATYVW